MTFQCLILRRWVFEAYCREYPTRNLELGIPAAGYSRCWVFRMRTLGLNFSTPSGGVTSPSLKGSITQTHKLSQMDIQLGGVQDHFLQNVLKFGFGDWKNVYETRRPNPIFPKISRKLDVWSGKMEKSI